MEYTFGSVMHCSFSFTIDANSFEEALEKSHELKQTRYYYEFPKANIGEIDLHLCFCDTEDENDIGIDEWV